MLRYKNGKFSQVESKVKVAENKRFEADFAFQLRVAGAPVCEPQYLVVVKRSWRIDFAWPDIKLAVEIQGGVWKKGGGGHSHPIGILEKYEKYNALASLGWRLLQFTTDQVESGAALQYTMTVLRGEVPNLNDEARHVRKRPRQRKSRKR